MKYVIRRLFLLLVSLACCVALSSCGGDGNANGNGNSKANVDQATASSGPDIPAYARSNDERGAHKFAEYWIETLNKATTSGNTKKLKTLQKKSCERCADFASQIDRIYAAGGRVETQGFQVKRLLTEAGVPKPGAGVSATVQVTPQTVYRTKKAEPQQYTGSELRLRMIMVRVGDHWLMDRIDL